MKKPPVIEHVSFEGSKGYTSKPIPRPPGKPMPPEEIIARLEHLIYECRNDYHYVPSREDEEAVKEAASRTSPASSTTSSGALSTPVVPTATRCPATSPAAATASRRAPRSPAPRPRRSP